LRGLSDRSSDIRAPRSTLAQEQTGRTSRANRFKATFNRVEKQLTSGLLAPKVGTVRSTLNGRRSGREAERLTRERLEFNFESNTLCGKATPIRVQRFWVLPFASNSSTVRR
jgi:hypothetical protein